MNHCSIEGCIFPGWVYFGNYEVPVDEDAPLKTWKETCFFCNGEKLLGGDCCICDENGQISVCDYTCATKKVEYRECPIHYGVFNFIGHLLHRLVDKVKLIITW